jgi:hypothetical protein
MEALLGQLRGRRRGRRSRASGCRHRQAQPKTGQQRGKRPGWGGRCAAWTGMAVAVHIPEITAAPGTVNRKVGPAAACRLRPTERAPAAIGRKRRFRGQRRLPARRDARLRSALVRGRGVRDFFPALLIFSAAQFTLPGNRWT